MMRFRLEELENVEAPIKFPLTKWWHYALAVVAIAAIILL